MQIKLSSSLGQGMQLLGCMARLSFYNKLGSTLPEWQDHFAFPAAEVSKAPYHFVCL